MSDCPCEECFGDAGDSFQPSVKPIDTTELEVEVLD